MIGLLFACTAHLRMRGGRLQMRQTAGPFIVSLFSTPETLGVGPADLSAMVEQREGGSVLLDADLVITLTPRTAGRPIVARLSHAHATNRLLQDAIVRLPHAGRWHALVQVSTGGRTPVRRPIWWWATILPDAARYGSLPCCQHAQSDYSHGCRWPSGRPAEPEHCRRYRACCFIVKGLPTAL